MNVSVIGLGKLGLPLLALLANSGHKVIGFDLSKDLMSKLRSGECPYPEPGLVDLLRSGNANIEYVDDFESLVEKSELAFVIVATPSMSSGSFDNSAVLGVCKEIGLSLTKIKKVFTVDIVSTVMPGSCEGVIRETLETHSGIKLGKELGLCYNPEFIALGSVIRDMQYPDMQLLGASSDFHADRVEKVLHSITRKDTPVRRMNLREAELVKISVNNFVTMKIAFANMLGEIAHRLGGIDVDVVTDAIGLDSRIGKKYLKAGAPFGGPCFPRDTKALTALLKDSGMENSLPNVVDSSNFQFQKHLLDRILKISNGKRIGVLGLSYKPDTPVIEESPGVKLLQDLVNLGIDVYGWDPLVKKNSSSSGNYQIIDDINEFYEIVDLVVITRPIPEVNKDQIEKFVKNKQVIDFWRNIDGL